MFVNLNQWVRPRSSTFFLTGPRLPTRTSRLDPVHLIRGQTIFNGPWVLAYFGPIKPAQFSLFFKAPVSDPIQGPNNSLPLASTTIRCRQLAAAVLRLWRPLSGQTPATFRAIKKKKKNIYIYIYIFPFLFLIHCVWGGMLEYVILYYSMFIVFLIGVYSLPYVVLGFLLTTHCIFINRDL